jgi:UDP-galactopyranose mutase
MRSLKSRICIVGAGFSGAVIARELACAGFECDVFEARSHVAGNSLTRRDPDTGVMLHVYGPHIFHTNSDRIWKYVQQFGAFEPFTNRVKSIAGGRVFSLPINLLTINQFFGKLLGPAEARQFLDAIGDRMIQDPRSFEDQALRLVGKELYEAFFKGYTIKQWGIAPSELPASVLQRLPVRFSYDDNYYNSKFQGMPRDGYTRIVENLLDHPGICLYLNSEFRREDARQYVHTFHSGQLDGWFGYCEGRLKYRTLDFELERHRGDYQGNPVINYCDQDVAWTRICEHKHFAPWEVHKDTVISREFSRSCGEQDLPFYPIPLVKESDILVRYQQLAAREGSVTFVGRLGTYRYLDMDVAIAEALAVAEQFLSNRKMV